MKNLIGILSDTHLKKPSKELQALLDGPFKKVDLIVHLGDFVRPEVHDFLSTKPFVGVAGNRDHRDLRSSLPQKELLKIGDYRIGLIHGWGAFWGMPERVKALFGKVDVILFGHTHRPFLKEIDGVLFMNPGSFRRDPFGGFKRRFGLLEIQREPKGRLCSL